MAEIYASIAEEIGVPPDKITIWRHQDYEERYAADPNYAPVPRTGNFANARLKPDQVLFMEVLVPLPEQPIATSVQAADQTAAFLAKTEKPTQGMLAVTSVFGAHAIGVAHLEHRDLHKPHITRQEVSSCYAIRVSFDVLRPLIAVAFGEGFQNHRIAYLFGRKQVITGKVAVHWAFIPQQNAGPEMVEVAEQEQLSVPRAIAQHFGMELVGCAVTRPYTDILPFRPYLIKLAARHQLANEHFATLVIMPIEGGKTAIDAYQVSDAAMKLVGDGYLVDTEKPDALAFKEDLKFCQFRRREIADSDLNLLLVPIRVRHPNRTRIAERKDHFPPLSLGATPLDLARYLTDNEYAPDWHRLFDFDLLTYLVEKRAVTIESELPVLVDAIIKKKEVPREIMRKVMKASASKK
jgi:hypothetical protein